jgi:hypothetical protein
MPHYLADTSFIVDLTQGLHGDRRRLCYFAARWPPAVFRNSRPTEACTM